ncbi:zinc finger matrin-type protein 5-like [Oncorhynchus keta]|uniref:zinc finger matrin-type protein 5-like n=1 Tax=Oncorhynchus keta TaxID=8018 RepID=UPI0015F99C99|nr:zinc finger matrin-type protein 5-like [Oncorhynchus keta]
MGKRYDCDRPFQDNVHNRKKHMYGVQHHRSKTKAWFDHFRGKKCHIPRVSLSSDERTKKPCRRFLKTGQCVFGNNCRFSHMSENEMENLRMQNEDPEHRASPERSIEDSEHRASPEQSIEESLTRGEKRRATLSSGSVLKEEDDDDQPENDIPPHFLTIPDLSPSIRPPHPSGSKVWLN